MSAFIVNDSHITALAAYVVNKGCYLVAGKTVEQVGQLLKDENYASVNHRYRESDTPEPFKLCGWAMLAGFEAVELLKLVRCYEYQTCEHPTWEQSEAWKIMQWMTGELINRLPGYSEAPWELCKPAGATMPQRVSLSALAASMKRGG